MSAIDAGAVLERGGGVDALEPSKRAGGDSYTCREAVQPVSVVVRPKPAAPGRFEVRVGGRLMCASAAPFCAAARVLVAGGVDQATVLTMRHEGSDVVALSATVGCAARLTVVEGSDGVARFRKWAPFRHEE